MIELSLTEEYKTISNLSTVLVTLTFEDSSFQEESD